jgi:hypothetical protein
MARCDCGNADVWKARRRSGGAQSAEAFDDPLTLEIVAQAAERVQQPRRAARSGHYLGLGLATVVSIVSTLIILSGRGRRGYTGSIMFEALRAYV